MKSNGSVLKEGYLELRLGASGTSPGEWTPVWCIVSGSAPIEGIRDWDDCALLLFSTSRKTGPLGEFALSGCLVTIHDEQGGELRLSCPGTGPVLALRAAPSLFRKWLHVLSRAGASSGGSSLVTPRGPPVPAEDDTAADRELLRVSEECVFRARVAEAAAARHEAAARELAGLEQRMEEMRQAVETSRRKKSAASLTPVKRGSHHAPSSSSASTSSSGLPSAGVVVSSSSSSSSAASFSSSLAGASVVPTGVLHAARHQGCNVQLLLEALRAKGASPEQTAKHLYSAMGHRPHEEEAAMQAMSPASVSLIDSLPKVSPTVQLEQLQHFISRDDPFAMDVLREYSAMFLRMKGLDVDLALRRLLYHFKLPRESQQIARVIRAFSEVYQRLHRDLVNFDHASSAFAPVTPDPSVHYGPGECIAWTDTESVELIVFALVMLNGDLHNAENQEKMTRPQFIENIKRSGATVVLAEHTLNDLYSRILHEPISHDNKLSPYPDALRKAHVDVKVKGVAGLRLWTRVWAVLTENYDVTGVTNSEQRSQRSGGYGLLFLCKSSRDESSVLLTFPLKRTVVLAEAGKREFSVSQAHGVGSSSSSSSSASSTLRGVLGSAPVIEETRVKFRCKTDIDYQLWIRSFQYLLSGGYGFWYPWEHRDFDLDIPDPVAAIGGKKTRRRRKMGTLKKKKQSTIVELGNNGGGGTEQPNNSPRNNEIDVVSGDSD